MDIAQLINHPERMDKDTLYELRALLALYPYYQPARLLLLKNLYLMHDSSFDRELRKAAIYITDRKKIFELVEARHYQHKRPDADRQPKTKEEKEQRTIALIDNFLDSLPAIGEEEKKTKRKPTPADASIDYVAYLLETEEMASEQPQQLRGLELIDDFINKEGGRIQLKEKPEFVPAIQENGGEGENDIEEAYMTETFAKIYIKQGRYSKALEIIKRLNLNYPKKNAYFADQIRFLEKLILNEQAKSDIK
ncbi:MAG: tetratricopeptide repeat protein [Prevotella sp.]|nr:tetratricopeptide repeat protein [Prevotella sp.]